MTENSYSNNKIPSVGISNIALSMFSDTIKSIKRALPKTCTFLSPLKTVDGEYQVLSIIGNNEYRFTVPKSLQFTQSDIKKLRSKLMEKISEHVD